MREIKFRAWAYKQMVANPGMIAGHFDDHEAPINKRFAEDAKEGDRLWMQYTGLKDKNGVEIFEGDIVRVTSLPQILDAEVAEVIWTNKYLGFGLRSICSTDPMLPHLIREIEVIGNIHENPELLKAA